MRNNSLNTKELEFNFPPIIKAFPYADTLEHDTIKFIDEAARKLEKTLLAAPQDLKMVVIIPAKDESQSVLYTLKSLLVQRDKDDLPFDTKKFEILVLCHNCADDTFQKCERFFRENPRIQGHVLQLDCERANTVGAARRVLMNIAHNRICNPDSLIISTDADTIPDNKWLYHLETYLESKIALVCGLIVVNPQNLGVQASTYLKAKDEYLLLKSRLEAEVLPSPHDPWPRHNYHWGPNLAIKKYLYGAIGGIRPLHFLEDVDLYHRAVSLGYLARHCNEVKVTTSTRIGSRCQEGFGAELQVWTEFDGVQYNVEGLEKLSARYEIYRLIKEYYESQRLEILIEIASLAYLDLKELHQMFNENLHCEAMIIKIEKHLNISQCWNSKYPNHGVLSVCKELNTYFDTQKAV